MSTSLSSLVENLFDGLHGYKCVDCISFLDYMIPKDDELIFRCFEFCEKRFAKKDL